MVVSLVYQEFRKPPNQITSSNAAATTLPPFSRQHAHGDQDHGSYHPKHDLPIRTIGLRTDFAIVHE
ncbi:MAG: hypothetical protein JWO05_1058 [Gemmatimonadetes bacterium]|nr:hypothetical protein [Gemmatimonadota bacterium]